MKTISFELPESLLLRSGECEDEVKERARFLLALKYFELGEMSSGRAAKLAGMTRAVFLFKASEHGVPIADLDAQELAQEIARA